MTKKFVPLIGRVTENDPIDRFSIGLKLSTRTDIAAYQLFYRDAIGDDIERTKLIEELLRTAFAKDTQFASWKKENPVALKAAAERANKADDAQG